ncbi:uncharacterized protein CCOS01_06160 [Colletotrichum costaricense]|uniref:Uncharacterized protein n=1 Tax=Colletotrichum costaricense TaxID=1209916 RepID=A0AAJ0E3M1_9PEZI|nr:uncharacterized protein CCOS01_06160 [Colletotrichum costaricense]KAI3546049.1 hypothetical protein CSPX01_04545 [Colletotrichum filicis]KAK1531057.1 hypothetical protein CCOS01_06160 [Colletotrichum costaricense]
MEHRRLWRWSPSRAGPGRANPATQNTARLSSGWVHLPFSHPTRTRTRTRRIQGLMPTANRPLPPYPPFAAVRFLPNLPYGYHVNGEKLSRVKLGVRPTGFPALCKVTFAWLRLQLRVASCMFPPSNISAAVLKNEPAGLPLGPIDIPR